MNIQEIQSLFKDIIQDRKGILGVASFQDVYHQLMPVQKKKLLKFGSGESLIVIGVFHSHEAIESINTRKNGKVDKEAWNIYANEYHDINRALNHAAHTLADCVNGIPIPATLEGVASEINRVEDYYKASVSQRVGAELAGLGWRGKNELIVTREKGCALRFASIISPDRLPSGTRMGSECGSCTACLAACPFLRRKHVLKNYREQCRRFIVTLRLSADVCGKCVKACYEHWLYNTGKK